MMHNYHSLTVVAGLSFFALSSLSQTSIAASRAVTEIAACVVEKDAARLEGVQDYSIDITMMGHEASQFFERTEIVAADGVAHSTFRLVPLNEIAKRTTADPELLSPESLEALASAYDWVGTELENEMNKSGLPVGMITSEGPAAGEEPWASPNPRVMMGAIADLYRGAAKAERNADDGNADAAAEINDMTAFLDRAALVGSENIEGQSSHHLKADDLNYAQVADGKEFIINTVSWWITKDRCMPIKMRMEGVADVDGESREMFIERLGTEFRNVPNSGMHESYRQVMRMGGVLSPAEMAEMDKARVQLAEFENQMASMPASQRAMVKKMMGSQMEMMRKMVETGAIEVETIVRSIRVNEGVEEALSHSAGAFGLMGTGER